MDAERAQLIVGALYEDWYSALVRYVFRSTGSVESAEDIVQSAFFALYRELLDGKPINNEKGWTMCVVKREIIKRYREEARRGVDPQTSADLDQLACPPAEDDAGAGFDERLSQFSSLLSEREEEVLLLRIQALKYGQIASELHISKNSVKTLLARAIRKLRQAASGEAAVKRVARPYAIRTTETLQ